MPGVLKIPYMAIDANGYYKITPVILYFTKLHCTKQRLKCFFNNTCFGFTQFSPL